MKEVSLVIFILLFVLLAGMAGCPPYNVWKKGLDGQANLRQAEQERQILVEQAKAEKESAQYRSDAIQIVGKAAQDFPEYRYQEFLGSLGEALREGNIKQIMYIPTESMIPITEATRLQ